MARTAVAAAPTSPATISGDIAGSQFRRPKDRGSVQRTGLNRLEGGHHPTGRPDRPGRRGGHRLGDPDVPADQGEAAELSQGPLVEPLLGPPAVLLGLLHEAEMLLQFPGFEPAGTGEESPGSGQILSTSFALPMACQVTAAPPARTRPNSSRMSARRPPSKQSSIVANDPKHYSWRAWTVSTIRRVVARPGPPRPARRPCPTSAGPPPGWRPL
jgi:hypothetical protein